MAEETVNVNPDGSTTFEGDAGETFAEDAGEKFSEGPEGTDFIPEAEEVAAGVDPAIYLLVVVVLLGIFYLIYRRKSREEEDDFFSNLDGEKFNIKLPSAVDEYYAIKEKCLAAGWQPDQPPNRNDPSLHTKTMAQTLMKRAVADIPIVMHIQKESGGMNKLYSQSMCSVKQWRAYQAAEAMVSAEVDEVRGEADQIEPGWGQQIWKQAMQYHAMLKQRHEMEQRAVAEQAAKKKAIEARVKAAKQKEMSEDDKVKAAERAAAELIKAEEREKQSKQAFQGGVKKGFLDNNGKKKK